VIVIPTPTINVYPMPQSCQGLDSPSVITFGGISEILKNSELFWGS